MTGDQLAALSWIGKGAIALFLLACVAALISAVSLLPHRAKFNQPGFSVWREADLRPKFVRFGGFCALGVIAALIGFTLGGWPTH
ncbi:MAG: hypothetical protein QM759_14785 [Terricaulis sp.]